MTKRVQRAAVEHVHPLWLRVLAFACLLLVVGASSVQAIHIHGQWLPQKAIRAGAPPSGAQIPGGEEHCPLCMAMHSALPVASHVELLQLALVECGTLQAMRPAPEAQWHFAMFSRPPPEEIL